MKVDANRRNGHVYQIDALTCCPICLALASTPEPWTCKSELMSFASEHGGPRAFCCPRAAG
eukprot:1158835-Pelagomonas_calceolata.AAC.24